MTLNLNIKHTFASYQWEQTRYILIQCRQEVRCQDGGIIKISINTKITATSFVKIDKYSTRLEILCHGDGACLFLLCPLLRVEMYVECIKHLVRK